MIWNYHEKLTAMASPTPMPPDALTPSIAPKLVPPRPTAPPSSVTRPARAPSDPARTASDPASAVEAALDATHRTSTSLSSLLDTLGRFTSGINGAQEASEQLKQELFMLRDMLGASNQEGLALKVRVDNLQRELEEAKNDAEQEQRYVRDEQDRFIAALMEEYEAEIDQLKQLLTTSEPVNPAITSRELRNALEAVEVAQAERQHSRDLAHRAQRQRDSAQREVARLQHELGVAQTKLTELATKFDDQHTRPTEPPPDDGPARPSSSGRRRSGRTSAVSDTDPAPKSPSIPNVDLRPAPRALEFADFEKDWDAAAIPAPPPSYDGAPAPALSLGSAPLGSAPLGSAPLATANTEPAFRHSAPPAELRAALTTPSSAFTRESRAPATAKVPSGSLPVASPADAMPHDSVATSTTDEAPSIVTNMRPSSVYPDPYRVESKPPLKRKPDHTQRPLVGYSKRADEIQPEQLGSTNKPADRDRDSH